MFEFAVFIAIVGGLISLGWHLYMQTHHPETYVKLMQLRQQKKALEEEKNAGASKPSAPAPRSDWASPAFFSGKPGMWRGRCRGACF